MHVRMKCVAREGLTEKVYLRIDLKKVRECSGPSIQRKGCKYLA